MGGSIDKDYPANGAAYAFEISEPAVDRILDTANPSFAHRTIALCKKDSADIADEDREKLLSTCQEATEDLIIVTHGTDTVIETAGYISAINNKTIVLTGAMKPERFINSDASFNIGVAIGALPTLPQGVYIAMSGLVLPWDNIKETGQQPVRFIQK